MLKNLLCIFSGMSDLGTLLGYTVGSSAKGTNADGSVVVGFACPDVNCTGSQAIRWTAATGMVGLGWLPGTEIGRAHV